jgi:hypothetical protein
MSKFNALSIAKLGVGFGALAVASLGLLSPASIETAQISGGVPYVQVQRDPLEHIRQDDDEVVLIIVSMLGELPCC